MTNAPKRTATLEWDNVETSAGEPVSVEAKMHIDKHSGGNARVSLRIATIGEWEAKRPREAYDVLQTQFDDTEYCKIAEAIARDLDHLAHRAVADFTAAASRYFLTTEGK
jgi:hypothetical protein